MAQESEERRAEAMTTGGSGMARELREAPDAVRRQDVSRDAGNDLVARCRANPPRLGVTCARGSSAHAATFGKHLIERYLRIPVAAAAPHNAAGYPQPLLLARPSLR